MEAAVGGRQGARGRVVIGLDGQYPAGSVGQASEDLGTVSGRL